MNSPIFIDFGQKTFTNSPRNIFTVNSLRKITAVNSPRNTQLFTENSQRLVTATSQTQKIRLKTALKTREDFDMEHHFKLESQKNLQKLRMSFEKSLKIDSIKRVSPKITPRKNNTLSTEKSISQFL